MDVYEIRTNTKELLYKGEDYTLAVQSYYDFQEEAENDINSNLFGLEIIGYVNGMKDKDLYDKGGKLTSGPRYKKGDAVTHGGKVYRVISVLRDSDNYFHYRISSDKTDMLVVKESELKTARDHHESQMLSSENNMKKLFVLDDFARTEANAMRESEIYEEDSKAKIYLKEVSNFLDRNNYPKRMSMSTFKEIENSGNHLLNNALSLLGVFGPEMRNTYREAYSEQKNMYINPKILKTGNNAKTYRERIAILEMLKKDMEKDVSATPKEVLKMEMRIEMLKEKSSEKFSKGGVLGYTLDINKILLNDKDRAIEIEQDSLLRGIDVRRSGKIVTIRDFDKIDEVIELLKYNLSFAYPQTKLTFKKGGEISGRYSSVYDFISRNKLEQQAENKFGKNWEPDDDMGMIRDLAGPNYGVEEIDYETLRDMRSDDYIKVYRYKKGGVLSGKELKKYIKKSDYYRDTSFLDNISDKDTYVLKNVDIDEQIQKDGTLSDFIHHDTEKYQPNENEAEWINKEPIIIGSNQWEDGIVLDGYHRIKQAKTNKEKKISAFVKKSKYKKGGTLTYKQKYNKKYDYPKNEGHSLAEISKDTGVSKKGLQKIYNKGVGAYKTNPQSVRPNVKSPEQWAQARVYSAVMGGKAAKVDAKELKMAEGGLIEAKQYFIDYGFIEDLRSDERYYVEILLKDNVSKKEVAEAKNYFYQTDNLYGDKKHYVDNLIKFRMRELYTFAKGGATDITNIEVVRESNSLDGVWYKGKFGVNGKMTWEVPLDKKAGYIIVQSMNNNWNDDPNIKAEKGDGAKAIHRLFLKYPKIDTILYDDESEGFWEAIGGEVDTLTREKFYNYYSKKDYAKGGEIEEEEMRDYIGDLAKTTDGEGLRQIAMSLEVEYNYGDYDADDEDEQEELYDEVEKAIKEASKSQLEEAHSMLEEEYAKGGALSKEFKFDKNFVVYVPSTSDVSDKISPKELDDRVNEVKEYVANTFGGYTETETEGGYKSSKGDIVEEDVVKVSVFSKNKDWKDKEYEVVKKAKEWAKEWGQEAIGFEYEGDLYYIDGDGKMEHGGLMKTIQIDPNARELEPGETLPMYEGKTAELNQRSILENIRELRKDPKAFWSEQMEGFKDNRQSAYRLVEDKKAKVNKYVSPEEQELIGAAITKRLKKSWGGTIDLPRGTGWGKYKKGKRILKIKDLKEGSNYLAYSDQFNAKNIVYIIPEGKSELNSPGSSMFTDKKVFAYVQPEHLKRARSPFDVPMQISEDQLQDNYANYNFYEMKEKEETRRPIRIRRGRDHREGLRKTYGFKKGGELEKPGMGGYDEDIMSSSLDKSANTIVDSIPIAAPFKELGEAGSKAIVGDSKGEERKRKQKIAAGIFAPHKLWEMRKADKKSGYSKGGEITTDTEIVDVLFSYYPDVHNDLVDYLVVEVGINEKDITDSEKVDALYNRYNSVYNEILDYLEGEEYAKGGLTKDKAKQILEDGEANGKALTDKQKRYFGWVAGGRKGKYGLGGFFTGAILGAVGGVYVTNEIHKTTKKREAEGKKARAPKYLYQHPLWDNTIYKYLKKKKTSNKEIDKLWNKGLQNLPEYLKKRNKLKQSIK